MPERRDVERMEILALIPARSGSKSVPHKNIRLLGGKPLLAHSIAHALSAKTVTRTIVSTDSAEYAEIAREYGADVPFLRPAELAGDLSTDLEVFRHALAWLSEREGYVPDVCVHLRPTCPDRDPADIDRMVGVLLQDPSLDSVRSIVAAPETPYKMWRRGENGLLSPVADAGFPEAYNAPRQILPPVFLHNGAIDVVRAGVIARGGSMTGARIYGFLAGSDVDIDHEADLARAAALSGPKTFCFDIDGVIATQQAPNEYDRAQPRPVTIAAVNSLYDAGHTILLFTARGSVSGIDWSDVTQRQLSSWGVKHHELVFGKPAADFYVDDRNLSIADAEMLAARLAERFAHQGNEEGRDR